jgi:hypothetical protein
MAPVSATYRATARREDKLWVVDVEGVGVTQGRSLAEARSMAVDLVVAMREVKPAAVSVDMQVALPGELGVKVQQVKKSRSQLELLQRQVGELGRGVVEGLRGAGLSGKDMAVVLGVSEQRVSQLTSAPATGSVGTGSSTRGSRAGGVEKTIKTKGGRVTKTAASGSYKQVKDAKTGRRAAGSETR